MINIQFLLKPTGSILLFHFKSKHTVVRANYGLSVAIFGFVICVIAFEMLLTFWQNSTFLEKNESFCHKMDNITLPYLTLEVHGI